MVTEFGEIVFIGTTLEALTYDIPYTTKLVDVQGYTILPGMHDVHLHPQESMSQVGGTCMLPQATSPEDMRPIFTEQRCQDNQVGTDWILGWGHDIESMLPYIDAGGNPRQLLDEYVTDPQGNPMPAIMMEYTSHSMWVNSKALELAGIDESVQDDPDRGMIYMRDPNTGLLNGILLENAGIAIMEHAMDIDVR